VAWLKLSVDIGLVLSWNFLNVDLVPIPVLWPLLVCGVCLEEIVRPDRYFGLLVEYGPSLSVGGLDRGYFRQ
jgi:hypothetical protein